MGAFFMVLSATGQQRKAPLLEEVEDPNTRRLSLNEVIKIAREQSFSYQQAITQLENRIWQNKTYKSITYPN